MDFSSSPGCNPGRPCHHHHHCHQNHHILCHHHPHCPLHSSQFTPIIHPQFNPSLAFSPFPPQHSNFLVSSFLQDANLDDKQIPEGVEQGLEEEVVEEEDYVYVLTDEWKEFFSKSEAKRRLAKKQAKKKKGN